MNTSSRDTGGKSSQLFSIPRQCFEHTHCRVQHHWKGCFISVFACEWSAYSFSFIKTSALSNRSAQWDKYCLLHLCSWLDVNQKPSVNIHSHMWGAVLFLYFLATFRSTYILPHPSTSWEDSAVFLAFLSSAVFCLSGSALYHTSSCHSEEVWITRGAVHQSSYVIHIVGFPGVCPLSCVRLFWDRRTYRRVILHDLILWFLLRATSPSILSRINHAGWAWWVIMIVKYHDYDHAILLLRMINRSSLYRTQSRICQAHPSRITDDGFHKSWVICGHTCVPLASNTWIQSLVLGNRAWMAACFRCPLYYRRVALVCFILLKLVVAHLLRHLRWFNRADTMFNLLSSANRIPERFAPGRFDYFFASHQIFHLCVVFAALAHYYSALESFEFRLLRPQFCDVWACLPKGKFFKIQLSCFVLMNCLR